MNEFFSGVHDPSCSLSSFPPSTTRLSPMTKLLLISKNVSSSLLFLTLQGKRYMVTFITSHHKHRVSLQHNVTFSTDTIEGTNW